MIRKLYWSCFDMLERPLWFTHSASVPDFPWGRRRRPRGRPLPQCFAQTMPVYHPIPLTFRFSRPQSPFLHIYISLCSDVHSSLILRLRLARRGPRGQTIKGQGLGDTLSQPKIQDNLKHSALSGPSHTSPPASTWEHGCAFSWVN